GLPRLRYILSTFRSCSMPMIIALPSRGLPPMRQANAKAGGAIEQQRRFRRKADKDVIVANSMRGVRWQCHKPFRSVCEPEQQHLLVVHRRDGKNARRNRVFGGGKRDSQILGPNAQPAWTLRGVLAGRTQPHLCAGDGGQQRTVL